MWLEPYPDELLEGLPDAAPGPDARYETQRQSLRAFLTALHRLPPRERATLVAARHTWAIPLWRSPTCSTPHRPRSTARWSSAHRDGFEERGAQTLDRAPLPNSPQEQGLVARFTDAFERGDVEPVIALLTEDAWWTMPPEPLGHQGRDAIRRFIGHAFGARSGNGRRRLFPTRANTQPAFGRFVKDPHPEIGGAVGLLVLTLDGEHVAHITRFAATSAYPLWTGADGRPGRARRRADLVAQSVWKRFSKRLSTRASAISYQTVL